MRPTHFYPDGKPIEDDELMPAWKKWAILFEQRDENRFVGTDSGTLYGEKLSTVWLGLDHSWGGGPPLIFETMLFAPTDPDAREDRRRSLRQYLDRVEPTRQEIERRDARRQFIEKYYPHDQLQLRYSTRAEAEDSHEQLKMQCLIPPRWRHFLLGTIGGIAAWKKYDEEETDWWR